MSLALAGCQVASVGTQGLEAPKIVRAAAEAGQDSAELEAEVDSPESVAAAGFYWGTQTPDRKVQAEYIEDGRFRARIGGLAPETGYRFCAFIGNGVSEIRSDTLEFRTISAPDPGRPVVLEDARFGEFVIWHFDADGDGTLSFAEAQCITYIDMVDDDVSSLLGIESFVNLEHLQVNGVNRGLDGPSTGKLTSVDLSHNTRLKHLVLDYQNLTELDVTSNAQLEYLGAFKNRIQSIDLSHNTELNLFGMGYSQLESIDFSHNVKLEEVHVDCNRLRTIELGSIPELKWLDCHGNLLTTIDISGCKGLCELHCEDNPYLKTIYMKAGQTLASLTVDDGVEIVRK